MGGNLTTTPTRDLFKLNERAAFEGDRVLAAQSGAELMRRTDTSPQRRAQANAEQADRRAEMRRTGADRRYV